MSPTSYLNRHNSNRFGTDLDYLQTFKNSQLLKIYANFGKIMRAYKSEVSTSG